MKELQSDNNLGVKIRRFKETIFDEWLEEVIKVWPNAVLQDDVGEIVVALTTDRPVFDNYVGGWWPNLDRIPGRDHNCWIRTL